MTKRLLQELREQRGWPCVTVVANCRVDEPSFEWLSKQYRSLVTEAEARLREECDPETAELMKKTLLSVFETYHPRSLPAALAVFASPTFLEIRPLTIAAENRVVVDRSFYIRDVLIEATSELTCEVICVSEKKVRVLEGGSYSLDEWLSEDLVDPHQHAHEYDWGIDTGNQTKAAWENEVRKIENTRHHRRDGAKMPVILVGVERAVAAYRDVLGTAEEVIGSITGNHDDTSVSELRDVIGPIVESYKHENEKALLEKLNDAVSAKKYSDTVADIARLAHESRVSLFVAERNYTFPADQRNGKLDPVESASAPHITDDLIDDIAEAVLNAGGEVRFVEPSTLPETHVMAALRY